ncbi:MAG: toll/interleukin-1 receptor domain-containing protein [Coriobacteriales bacterium]
MRQPGAPETDATTDFAYSAFISYRHVPRDTEVATKVQKAIETYRFPKAAAEFSELVGEDRRLLKAFRDEDELAAAPSLPESIKTALARSSALVVVCSSDTASSHWVQEEIELFAALHGRDRIFPVLAEGASAEVIPQMLQEHVVVGQDGEVRTEHASPFAADYRPSAANQEKTERMRLLAALADCPYDALRQRDRARKQQRMGMFAAAVVVIVLAIGGLSAHAHSQRMDALTSQSKQLAAESRELFEQGDRYGAIEKALAALPDSDNDKSRPLVTEAREALEEALDVYPSGSTEWSKLYMVRTENPIVQIDDSPKNEWFALLEADHTLKTYELATGRELATCFGPAAEGLQERPRNVRFFFEPAGRFVISSDSYFRALTCFHAYTGKVMWARTGIQVAAIGVADDFETIAFAYQDDNDLLVASVETETGDELYSHRFENCQLNPSARKMECSIGTGPADVYVASDGFVAHANLDTGDIEYAPLSHKDLWKMVYRDGTVVVSSYDEVDPGVDVACSFEGFDAHVKPIWAHEEIAETELLESDRASHNEYYSGAFPQIYVTTIDTYLPTLDRTCVLCSAGYSAMLYALDDGEELYRFDEQSYIAGASMGADAIFLALADGEVRMRDLDLKFDNSERIARRYLLETPFQIAYGKARVCTPLKDFVFLSWPSTTTTSEDCLVAYRLSGSNREQPDHEPTLDELIAEANRVLEEAGRR